MRVLLIEDNVNYAHVVEYLLRTAQGPGLDFHSVDSLAQGITQLRQASFDVLLLDLSLPDSQGLETLIHLQENAKTVPIVVLTGNDDEQLALDAMRHGAQDYLVKTIVDRQALTRAIRYAIERKNAEVRLQRQRQRQATLQQEMRDTERRYEELIDNIDAIVWEADPTRSRFTYVSKAAEEKLGFAIPLWLEEGFWSKQIHPDDRSQVRQFLQTAGMQDKKRELEYRVLAADGRILWLRDIIRIAKNNEGQPAPLRGVMVDITQAKDAEAALQKHSAAILSLQEIGQKVLDAEDDGGAIESILDLAMNLVGYELGAVRILAPTGNLAALTMRGSGTLQSICSMSDFCQIGARGGVENIFSRTLANKKTQIFKSVLGIPEFSSWQQQGALSAVVVPIMAQNEALGILAVGSRQMTMLRPNQVHLLETLASQVGFVIQKEALCEEIRGHLNWIESLREFEKSMVSTLDLDGAVNLLLDKIDTVFQFPVIVIVQLIDFQSGDFAVTRCRNFDTEQWIKAHNEPLQVAQSGLARAVVEAGAPISIYRLSDDPRVKNHEFNRQQGVFSYLGIPLTVRDKTVGVLGIATKREYVFPKHEIDYISSLASHAAIAIQNAYLYTELDKNSQGLSALFDVTSAASHSLEMPRILREVVRKISSIFSFDATKMYLFDDVRDALRIRAAYEVPASSTIELESIKKGEGVVGQVAVSGEPMIVANTATDLRYQHAMTATSIEHESLACFPIRSETEILGVILCFSRYPRELSDNEIRLITSMTNEIAVAVVNTRRYERSKKQNQQLRHLATHLESVREKERTRIAREIHDELGQLLTALKFDFSWLRGKVMNTEPAVAERFAAVAETLDVTLQTVRKISTQLRPDVLDKVGLTAAIEWQLQEFRRRTGTRYHFISKPPDIRIDDGHSTAIFRIFQEALTNVTRHGQASRVRITLALKTRQISLRVEDNGIGINTEKLQDSNSLGLLGMRERAASLGGRVTIRKNQKFGTTVLVCLPLGTGGHDAPAIETKEAIRSTL